MAAAEESQLVSGLKAGNPEAVEKLVGLYADRMLRAACLICGDPHLAEDLTQETLLAAMRGIGRFRGDSGLYTWLYRILVNQCRARARKKSGNEQPIDLTTGVIDRTVEHNAEDAAIAAGERGRVSAAVAALPAAYREVVVLFYYEEMTVEQIAAVLDERPGTLKSRLYRARKTLSEALGEEGF